MFLLERICQNLRTLPKDTMRQNHRIPVATSRAELAYFLGETRWFDLLIPRKSAHDESLSCRFKRTYQRLTNEKWRLVSHLDSARSESLLCTDTLLIFLPDSFCIRSTTLRFSLVWDVQLSFLRRLNPGTALPKIQETAGTEFVHGHAYIHQSTWNTVPHNYKQPRSLATFHLVINSSHHPPLPNSIRSNENADRSGLLIKTSLNSKFPRPNKRPACPAWSPSTIPAIWTSTLSSSLLYLRLSPCHLFLIFNLRILNPQPCSWLATLYPTPLVSTNTPAQVTPILFLRTHLPQRQAANHSATTINHCRWHNLQLGKTSAVSANAMGRSKFVAKVSKLFPIISLNITKGSV